MNDERSEAPASSGRDSGVRPAVPPSPDAAIETALYALAARQAVLAELGMLALGAKSLQALLDQAVASMRATLEVDTCTVLELLPGGDRLLVRAAVGWSEPVAGRLVVDAGTGSHAGFTLLSSEPVVVDDTAAEARFSASPFLAAQGIRSGMNVVIHGRDRPYGVFSVQHRALRRFTREEVDYFQAAANVIALAAGRFQTEEGLRRSEESFRSLIEHAPEGVLINRRGIVVYVNRALLACLGYDRAEELLGRPGRDLVHPEDRALVAERGREMDATNRPVAPHELRLLRRDGTVLVAESAGVPVVFDGQRSIAALIRDITERKKIEARLHQSERLSALGVLAAGVAHEINNPLMYVLGNIELAREAVADPGGRQGEAACARDVADLLDRAREGGERVRRIVADLKALSRRSGTEESLSPVDVRAVITSAVGIARNELRQRAQLVIEYGDVPVVMASESRLGQVLLNLLLNAAHAIPEGAAAENRITVKTGTDPDGRAVIEVRDTGVGIPEENLGKLFDPFFTTKPQGVGTGLGLAICHEIVAALGGDIAVESEVGRGTTFRIALPPAPEPRGKAAAKARAGGEARAAGAGARDVRQSLPRGRVLVVDDEPFIAGLCRRALSPEHDVEVATSAGAALEYIERVPGLDVVLCDLMMPGVSGMELFEIVERRFPALAPRFVFFSGGAFTQAARSFRERVPNPCLDKPCAPALLRDTVRERVRRARSGQL